MATAFNHLGLVGKIVTDPYFVKKDGVPFEVRFTLQVRRQNKKDYDYIPVRYVGENRMKYAEYLKKGDQVSIFGEFRSGQYESKTKVTVYELYVRADDICWTPKNIAKEKTDQDVPMTGTPW